MLWLVSQGLGLPPYLPCWRRFEAPLKSNHAGSGYKETVQKMDEFLTSLGYLK